MGSNALQAIEKCQSRWGHHRRRSGPHRDADFYIRYKGLPELVQGAQFGAESHRRHQIRCRRWLDCRGRLPGVGPRQQSDPQAFLGRPGRHHDDQGIGGGNRQRRSGPLGRLFATIDSPHRRCDDAGLSERRREPDSVRAGAAPPGNNTNGGLLLARALHRSGGRNFSTRRTADASVGAGWITDGLGSLAAFGRTARARTPA